jgi:hypothetical protein
MRKAQVQPESPNPPDFDGLSPATAVDTSLSMCNGGLEALSNTFASFHKRLSALEEHCSKSAIECNSPLKALTSTSQKVISTAEDKGRGSVFAGPTSANFSFQVANMMSLASNQRADDSADIATEDEIEVYVSPEDDRSQGDRLAEDEIPLTEAVRLLRVYDEVVNSLHPIPDVDVLVSQAEALYAGRRTITKLTTDHECLMGLVVAVALLAEKGGVCPTALAIYQRTKPFVADLALEQTFTVYGQTFLVVAVGTDVRLKCVTLTLFRAFFHMFHDDLRLATRLVAVASRIAMEAGLHRKQVVLQRFPNASERKKVMILNYTLTVLDRQMNFNSGLPFTMRDIEIEISESVSRRSPCLSDGRLTLVG